MTYPIPFFSETERDQLIRHLDSQKVRYEVQYNESGISSDQSGIIIPNDKQ